MALQTIVGGLPLFAMPQGMSGVLAITNNASLSMASASQQCGFVFAAPKAGNIRKLSVIVTSVTSAPTNTHDFRLETVSTTTGLNTGSLVGTTTNAAVLLNTTGWKTVTLTLDATVTDGQLLALIVVAPGSNQGSIRLGTFFQDYNDFPYMRTVGGAVSGGNNPPVMAIEYDDATIGYVPGCWPIDSVTSPGTFASAAKRGIRFKVPFKARLAGCHLYGDLDGDCNIVLYEGGTTATTLMSFDKDTRGTTVGGNYKFAFTTKPTLAAATYYRLVVAPTSATACEIFACTVNAAKYLDALPGGQDLHYTTVASAPGAEGDWTNTLTTRPFLTPIFDQLDDGLTVGGGSFVFVG